MPDREVAALIAEGTRLGHNAGPLVPVPGTGPRSCGATLRGKPSEFGFR